MATKQLETPNKNSNKISNYDLFDNPMTRAAHAALSDEDKKRYKEIGKKMYNINFEKSSMVDIIPQQMKTALFYIEKQLQSGLHPSDLDEHETAILIDSYGNDWYKKWNYNTKDLKHY